MLGSVTEMQLPRTRTVRIRNNLEGEAMKLLGVESDNPVFLCTVAERKPNEEFALTVRTTGTLSLGPNVGFAKIRTSNPRQPVISVKCKCFLKPMVEAVPGMIALSPGPLEAREGKSVLIFNNDSDRKIGIVDAQAPDPSVTVAIEETKPGKRFRAVLSFPPGYNLPRGAKAFATFRTDHPVASTLRVPVLQNFGGSTAGASH